MNKTRTTALAVSLMSLCFSATAGDALELINATLDGGGGQSAGGNFVLHATIGQPDAGRLQGGSFELQGGFWATESVDFLFKDGFDEH